MVRKLREWAVALILTLVAIEVAFQAVVRLGFVHIPLPSYSLANAAPFWRAISKDFGVWHLPHAQYRHRKTCFDVVYSTNSHGMRDAEVPLRSTQPRVAVVGDSFVEGWGVAYGNRLTERLKDLTRVDHLNFGTSGGFGPTQAFLLYKTFAARFDHEAVIFSILPDNDFTDDAPGPESANDDRRPYLIGEYPDYEIRPQRLGSQRGLSSSITAYLDEFWLTYRARPHVVQMIRSTMGRNSGAKPSSPTGSYYYDYQPDQFDRLRYAIEQIKATAGDRQMLIFTIPRSRDYQRAESEGGTPPLTAALRSLAASLAITYVDLLELTRNADWKTFFPDCDGHWSNEGHRVAAEVLFRHHPLRAEHQLRSAR